MALPDACPAPGVPAVVLLPAPVAGAVADESAGAVLPAAGSSPLHPASPRNRPAVAAATVWLPIRRARRPAPAVGVCSMLSPS